MSTATSLTSDLQALVGDPSQVNAGDSVRRLHGEPFIGHFTGRLPDVVVFPRSTAEVSAVMAFAFERRIPVVPFGAGSSAEGEIVPVQGGISLDLTGLQALEVRPADLQATIGAGVTRLALERAAGQHGLWFPVDPGADASLGGMCATNASGTTTVRYGSMRQNVLALEVVRADGDVIRTGARTMKTSAGYNLTNLFVGSEGTLGVITEATLRLYGIPEQSVVVRTAFERIEDACACAVAIVGGGLDPLRVELLDDAAITWLNAFNGTGMPERPHLFIELGGSPASLDADVETTRELAQSFDSLTFEGSRDPTERSRLWSARHDFAHAMMDAHRGKSIKGTDTCVPLSELPAAVQFARVTMQELGLDACVLGHVGDGNYHVTFAVDESDPEEQARVAAGNEAIVADCLSRGGTCSGEHGIGLGKRAFLAQEHADTIELMRELKGLLDPRGILNPGKILPDA
ncbi:MAG TPA: FAD-linked oxidase C-terminal domain-containing protein [Solirubrobacteraceae bacterium]|nr:FAD-linked oxidase C-terminal domain-containing protein [Solirubrobacteraceae bacterium]